jgi:IS30 family transposase
MKQRSRIYYTESQKAQMWERWQKGESLQQIAQLFDRNHSSVQRILAERGGIRPPPRCRAKVALNLAEREEISRAMVAGHSMRSVTTRLGRAPSTISRAGRRAMATVLLTDPRVTAGPLYYRQLDARHPLHHAAAAWCEGVPPRRLPARRALFSHGSARLLVTKVYLPW